LTGKFSSCGQPGSVRVTVAASCSSVSEVMTWRTVAWRSRRIARTSSSEGCASRSHGMPSHPGASSHGRSSGCPRRGGAEDHPVHPGGCGEAEVPQGLDERPLVVDAAMELRYGERTSPRDGTFPQPFQDRPRCPETVGVVGAHLRPLRHAAVQFRVDEWCDVDALMTTFRSSP